VLRDLLPSRMVGELAEAVDHYVMQRGARVTNMSKAPIVLPPPMQSVRETTHTSWFIADPRSAPDEPALRHLVASVDANARLRATLSEILGSERVRFLGRNELLVNRLLSWHRDMLDGALAAYTRHLNPWRLSDGYSILAVVLFLQDHSKDRMGLVVKPGTHTLEAINATSHPGGVVIGSGLGDAIVFDTRLWHRSGHSQVAIRHGYRMHWLERASHAPSKATRRLAPRHRALLTVSYGLPGSAFARAHEAAMAMRYKLLTDARVCNATRERASRIEWAKVGRCVKRVVARDVRAQTHAQSRTEGPAGVAYL
jgi:hypothetical protein